MAIDFTPERWDIVKETYTKWWAGELDRSLIRCEVTKADAPAYKDILSQSNCHDFSKSAEDVIDGIDYNLSRKTFLADSYPYFNMDAFGPGVLAAFCGARLDNSSGRVWFYPQKELDIKDIHIEYDPNNVWAKRVKDIYHAANKKWKGSVLMSMVDLGGVLDVVATFRGSENLLMDLYDYPEEVRRLCEETQKAWFDAYCDLNEVLMQENPGYSDWSGLYSKTPSYVVQSDFTYMISLDMFKEFAYPEINDTVQKLDNVIYHLDGEGELKHLDTLLGIEKLKAVQWVFGDGAPEAAHWIDSVYKKIQHSGKNIQVLGNAENMKAVRDALGSKGLYFIVTDETVKTDIKTAESFVASLL